jgi:hypothetical protein
LRQNYVIWLKVIIPLDWSAILEIQAVGRELDSVRDEVDQASKAFGVWEALELWDAEVVAFRVHLVPG